MKPLVQLLLSVMKHEHCGAILEEQLSLWTLPAHHAAVGDHGSSLPLQIPTDRALKGETTEKHGIGGTLRGV